MDSSLIKNKSLVFIFHCDDTTKLLTVDYKIWQDYHVRALSHLVCFSVIDIRRFYIYVLRYSALV